MFLPHMPGDYDILAPTLSFIAQLLAFAGLILVPIGIVWLTYETIKYAKKETEASNAAYYFALVALIALFIIGIAISLTVFISNNRSLGFIIAIAVVYYFSKVIARTRRLKNVANKNFNAIPFYLVCIPLLVQLIRYTLLDQAVAYSRNRAIRQSEQLIKDIEIYYQHNGHYPLSILSVWKDYKTSVIGVKQYHYEPAGKAYNLYFEQVSDNPATKEIVMYNKLDEQEMTSHDQDLLLLSPHALDQQRGYFAVHNLSQPHWKQFLFD